MTDPTPSLAMRLLEADRVPDWLIRQRIRSLLADRLREEDRVEDLDNEGLAATVRVRDNEAERLTLAACDAVTLLEQVVDGEDEAPQPAAAAAAAAA
jgi:hypothetical protein